MAEWIAAFAAVAAFVASMLAWRTSERMLLVGRGRDREQEMRLERAAASRFFAAGVTTKRQGKGKWGIYVNNFSTEPIWDVEICSQKLNGKENNPPLRMKFVLPGSYLVTAHEEWNWSSPIDLSISPEPLEFLTRTKVPMITSVSHVDLLGGRWEMREGDYHPRKVS
ncbi:hypothetical protein V5S96_08230 [Corynebacterium mastitidis]|uniref:DUF2550 domain-containing protein n=1 Tax=Corynebacterium mastitidis TaxID=161890 RepID=A0ABU8P1I8_9CORY